MVVRQTGLNKFHADVAHEIMTEAGYEPAEDVELYARVRDLLLKRTLARPLLPSPLKGTFSSLPIPASTRLIRRPQIPRYTSSKTPSASLSSSSNSLRSTPRSRTKARCW